MTYQLIDNFAAGQDNRKSPLTSPAGTLTKLINAVITPGGEIAKRRAFTLAATVSGTFGMAATESTLFVFGKNVDPSLPAWSITGINLRGAKIPNVSDGLEQMDYDVFDGLIYLACRTTNPASFIARNPHYYLGLRSGSTTLYDGVETEGSGKGYFVRTFKSKVYSVLGKLMYFSAIGNPMVWDDETLLDTVVVTKLDNTNPVVCTVTSTEIAQFVTNKYVYISGATVAGLTNANGFRKIGTVNPTAGTGIGTFQLVGVNGTTATADQIDDKVRATPAIPITQISNTNPAVVTVSSTDIGKFVDGMKIRINGIVGGIVPPPTTEHPNSNVFIIENVGSPANTFALPTLDASSFAAPQGSGTWLTLTSDIIRTGRGFINLSLTDAASENLRSIEVYYDKLAVFSTRATQIWAITADPLQNAFDQLLRGSGTSAARSPLQYGSGDVLYLDQSGVRSLKAKDSSNSAAVSDIGSPVDPVINEILLTRGQAYLDKSVALLEPVIGRFWMVFPDEILVLSYFPGPKITAWSRFTLPELGGSDVVHAATCGGRIFLRDALDRIWIYGGPAGTSYTNLGTRAVEVRMPYLDGKKPGHKKTFQAFDATVNNTWGNPMPTGDWEVAVSYDPDNPEQEEIIGTINKPTWNIGASEMQGYDSHFSLRFYNSDALPASISNCAVHYNIADDES